MGLLPLAVKCKLESNYIAQRCRGTTQNLSVAITKLCFTGGCLITCIRVHNLMRPSGKKTFSFEGDLGKILPRKAQLLLCALNIC